MTQSSRIPAAKIFLAFFFLSLLVQTAPTRPAGGAEALLEEERLYYDEEPRTYPAKLWDIVDTVTGWYKSVVSRTAATIEPYVPEEGSSPVLTGLDSAAKLSPIIALIKSDSLIESTVITGTSFFLCDVQDAIFSIKNEAKAEAARIAQASSRGEEIKNGSLIGTIVCILGVCVGFLAIERAVSQKEI